MARKKRKDSPEANEAGEPPADSKETTAGQPPAGEPARETAVGHDVVAPELSEEDTAERAALKRPDATEVYFSREEPEAAAVEPEPAAVEPEPAVVVEPEPAVEEPALVEPEPAVEEPAVPEPAAAEPEPVAEPEAAQPAPEPQPAAAPPTYGTGGTSPAAADRRAAETGDSFSERPELVVAAVFVGALVLAKLLKRLTRGSGD